MTQLAAKKRWLNVFHLAQNLIISPKGKILASNHQAEYITVRPWAAGVSDDFSLASEVRKLDMTESPARAASSHAKMGR